MTCSAALGAEYYERCYPDYAAQNPPYKLRYYRDLVTAHAPLRDPLRVVDVGCAFGDFLSILPAQWKRVGLDTNAFAISAARRRFAGIEFKTIDGFDLPLDGADVVTAFDVLEHVPDLDRAFASIRAALSPGGTLVMVVPVYDGPLGPVVWALDKDPTHVHKRSRKFWLDAVAEHFTILHYEGVLRYLVPGVQRYVHVHGKALSTVSPAVAIAARA